MKKLFVMILALLVITPLVYAEISVIYDKNTKEILFIAEEGERFFLKDPDHKVEVLPNDLSFYDLEFPHSDYKLQGKRIITNTRKISDRSDMEDGYANKKQQEAEDKITAKDKLIVLGFSEGETEVILNK